MPGSSTGRQSRNCSTQTHGVRLPLPVSAREKGTQVGTYPEVKTHRATSARSLQPALSARERSSIGTSREARTYRPGSARTMEQQKQMFPKMCKSSGEVYMFMRGKKEYLRRFLNAFTRDKRVVANYGGQILGMSDCIKRYEGDLYRGMAEQIIVVMLFRDFGSAERWTQSSNLFKQKDFPSPADEIELFCIPVNYLPNEDLTAFQLTEMHGMHVCPNDFHKNYVSHVTRLLDARRIYHGVVASNDVSRLRNCMIRPATFVLLNCAESETKLKEFYDSADYAEYKNYRQATVAETDSCFFTIKPLTSY